MAQHSYWKLVGRYKVPTLVDMRSIYYYYSSAPIDPTTLQMQTVDNTTIQSMMTLVSAQANWYQMDWYYLDASNEWQPHASYLTNVNGSRAGEMLPPQLAGVVVARTQHKRTMGKKFISPMSESDLIYPDFTSSWMTVANAFINSYISTPSVGGVSWTPGVFDKTFNFWPFTSGFLSPVMGTNRRRVLGHGI